MPRKLSLSALVFTLTFSVLIALAGAAGAATEPPSGVGTGAANDDPFCTAAFDAYDASTKYTGKGPFAEAARIGPAIRQSAEAAPPKIRKAALRIAKVYEQLAKVKNSRLQSLRWATWASKYSKSFEVYYGYYAERCIVSQMPDWEDLDTSSLTVPMDDMDMGNNSGTSSGSGSSESSGSSGDSGSMP